MKLVLLLAVTLLAEAHCNTLQSRVIDGIDANMTTFPFVVSIQTCIRSTLTCEHKCTGIIISKKLVLTTVNCVAVSNKKKLRKLRVQAGLSAIQTDDGPTKLKISKVIVPRNYTTLTVTYKKKNQSSSYSSPYTVGNDYDMAVVVMKNCFNFNNGTINKIELVDETYIPPNLLTVTVAGWGATDPFNLKPATSLKYAHVKIIPNWHCGHFSHANVTRQQICTFERATGLCPKDAGSPLIITEINGSGQNVTKLIGVYSHTTKWTSHDGLDHDLCGLNPDIYTSIAELRSFIDTKMTRYPDVC